MKYWKGKKWKFQENDGFFQIFLKASNLGALKRCFCDVNIDVKAIRLPTHYGSIFMLHKLLTDSSMVINMLLIPLKFWDKNRNKMVFPENRCLLIFFSITLDVFKGVLRGKILLKMIPNFTKFS